MTVSAVLTPTFTVPPCSQPVPDLFLLDLLGGAQVSLPILPGTESLLRLALRGCQGVMPGMAAMAPILTLLRAVAAVKDFIVDFPANLAQALPPLLNAQPMKDAVTRLETALANVVGLTVPAFAFGKQLLGTIKLVRLVVQGLKQELLRFIARNTDINGLLQRANQLANQQLLQLAQCEQQRLASDIALVNRSVEASLGPLLAFANVLLCLVLGHDAGKTMPVVPAIDPNGLAAELFDPVDTALGVLESLVAPFAGSGASFDC